MYLYVKVLVYTKNVLYKFYPARLSLQLVYMHAKIFVYEKKTMYYIKLIKNILSGKSFMSMHIHAKVLVYEKKGPYETDQNYAVKSL